MKEKNGAMFLVWFLVILIFMWAADWGWKKCNAIQDEAARYKLMGPSEREWNDRIYEMKKDKTEREKAYQRLYRK